MSTTIFGIMITGEPKRGPEFAVLAANNFRRQSYGDLHLIVINHGKTSLAERLKNPEWMTEVMMLDKPPVGAMRNIAFQHVPEGGWWVQWDDDDWRDLNLLEQQFNFACKGAYQAVFLCNMINYEVAMDFAWYQHMWGIPGTIMAKKIPRQYLSMDGGEDTFYFWSLMYTDEGGGRSVGFFENNPAQYIRTVHPSNLTKIALPEERDKGLWHVPYKSFLTLRNVAPLLQDAYRKRREKSC